MVLIEDPGIINLGLDDVLYYDVDPITYEVVPNFCHLPSELLKTPYLVHIQSKIA